MVFERNGHRVLRGEQRGLSCYHLAACGNVLNVQLKYDDTITLCVVADRVLLRTPDVFLPGTFNSARPDVALDARAAPDEHAGARRQVADVDPERRRRALDKGGDVLKVRVGCLEAGHRRIADHHPLVRVVRAKDLVLDVSAIIGCQLAEGRRTDAQLLRAAARQRQREREQEVCDVYDVVLVVLE